MKQVLRWTLFGILILTVNACGGSPTTNDAASPGDTALDSETEQPRPTDSPTPTEQPTDQASSRTTTDKSANPGSEPAKSSEATPAQPLAAKSSQTEEVTIYRLDNQCQDYIAQKMMVPKADATQQIVGKVIENSNSPDFKIDSYRVQVQDNRATIDLRLPPDAKRPFAAMSTCEQQALLGSMQKTLTSNPNLRIQSVRFTDGKEELLF